MTRGKSYDTAMKMGKEAGRLFSKGKYDPYSKGAASSKIRGFYTMWLKLFKDKRQAKEFFAYGFRRGRREYE
jgi:hypothetical protein